MTRTDLAKLSDIPAGSLTLARKTADQVTTSTSFADVTDLTFAVQANTNYRFRFLAFIAASVATEGYNLSVNGPAGTYKMAGILPLAVPSSSAGNVTQHAQGAAADTGGLAAGSSGGAAPVPAFVEGVVLIGGAGGTLALRVKAETGGANSVTVQANSYGEISEI